MGISPEDLPDQWTCEQHPDNSNPIYAHLPLITCDALQEAFDDDVDIDELSEGEGGAMPAEVPEEEAPPLVLPEFSAQPPLSDSLQGGGSGKAKKSKKRAAEAIEPIVALDFATDGNGTPMDQEEADRRLAMWLQDEEEKQARHRAGWRAAYGRRKKRKKAVEERRERKERQEIGASAGTRVVSDCQSFDRPVPISLSSHLRPRVGELVPSSGGSSSTPRGDKPSRRKRALRCNQCAACLRPYCGKCKPCLDKPVFGGEGNKKQVCVMRRCEQIAYPVLYEHHLPPGVLQQGASQARTASIGTQPPMPGQQGASQAGSGSSGTQPPIPGPQAAPQAGSSTTASTLTLPPAARQQGASQAGSKSSSTHRNALSLAASAAALAKWEAFHPQPTKAMIAEARAVFEERAKLLAERQSQQPLQGEATMSAKMQGKQKVPPQVEAAEEAAAEESEKLICSVCMDATERLVLCRGYREANMDDGIAELGHALCVVCVERWRSAQNELRAMKGLLPKSRRECPVCRSGMRQSSAMRNDGTHVFGLCKIASTWPMVPEVEESSEEEAGEEEAEAEEASEEEASEEEAEEEEAEEEDESDEEGGNAEESEEEEEDRLLSSSSSESEKEEDKQQQNENGKPAADEEKPSSTTTTADSPGLAVAKVTPADTNGRAPSELPPSGFETPAAEAGMGGDDLKVAKKAPQYESAYLFEDLLEGEQVLAYGSSPSSGWCEFRAVVVRPWRAAEVRFKRPSEAYRVGIKYVATHPKGEKLALLLPQPNSAVLDRSDVRKMPSAVAPPPGDDERTKASRTKASGASGARHQEEEKKPLENVEKLEQLKGESLVGATIDALVDGNWMRGKVTAFASRYQSGGSKQHAIWIDELSETLSTNLDSASARLSSRITKWSLVAPPWSAPVHIVDYIVDERTTRNGRGKEYLVKWVGYKEVADEMTWESYNNLKHTDALTAWLELKQVQIDESRAQTRKRKLQQQEPM